MKKLQDYREIIIWGAAFPPTEADLVATSHGHAMDKLVDLLQKEHVWENVVAFVDSNRKVQGRKRLDLPVLDPSVLSEHKEALVIINSISIVAIKNAMDALGATNDCAVIPYYFYHGTLDFPYDNAAACADAKIHGDEIRALYDCSDPLSARYLEIIMDMRLAGEDRLYDISYYDGTGLYIPYFCDEALAPKGDVTYIDVGAFDGDSLSPVKQFFGDRLKRYIAFEPGEAALSRLKDYVREHRMEERSLLLPYALGDRDTKIRFSVSGGTSQQSEHGEIVLEQKRFDGLPPMETVGDVLVKMDIEGAELGAIEGMRAFISANDPYLAICTYHKETDLYEIARLIRQIGPKYRLFIRGGWHLECWAIPERHFNQ